MVGVVPTLVEKALTDFKARPMAKDLEKSKMEVVKEFKAKDLPKLLQKKFDSGFMAFANSKQGEEYIHVEWDRGLIDYRNVMIHCNPLVNSKKIDQYFPDLFDYAFTKVEVFPEIADCYIPNPPKEEEGDERTPEGATTSTLAQP